MAGDSKHFRDFAVESTDNLRRFSSNLNLIISKYDRSFSDDEDINISSLSVVKEKEQSILSECCSESSVNETIQDHRHRMSKDKVLNLLDGSNSSDDFEVWGNKSSLHRDDKQAYFWGHTFVKSPTEHTHYSNRHREEELDDEVNSEYSVLKDKYETALSILESSDNEEPSDGETLSSFSSSDSDWEDVVEAQTGEDEEDFDIYTTLSSCSEDEVQIVDQPVESNRNKENAKHHNRYTTTYNGRHSPKQIYEGSDLETDKYKDFKKRMEHNSRRDMLIDQTYSLYGKDRHKSYKSPKQYDHVRYQVSDKGPSGQYDHVHNQVSHKGSSRQYDHGHNPPFHNGHFQSLKYESTKLWTDGHHHHYNGLRDEEKRSRKHPDTKYKSLTDGGNRNKSIIPSEPRRLLPENIRWNVSDEIMWTEKHHYGQRNESTQTKKQHYDRRTISKHRVMDSNNNHRPSDLVYKWEKKQGSDRIMDVIRKHAARETQTKVEKQYPVCNKDRGGIRKQYRPVLPEVSTEHIYAYLTDNDISIQDLYSPSALKNHRNKFKIRESSDRERQSAVPFNRLHEDVHSSDHKRQFLIPMNRSHEYVHSSNDERQSAIPLNRLHEDSHSSDHKRQFSIPLNRSHEDVHFSNFERQSSIHLNRLHQDDDTKWRFQKKSESEGYRRKESNFKRNPGDNYYNDMKANQYFTSPKSSEKPVSSPKFDRKAFMMGYSDRNTGCHGNAPNKVSEWPGQHEDNEMQISRENQTLMENDDKDFVYEHFESIKSSPFNKSARNLTDINDLVTSEFDSSRGTNKPFKNESRSVPAKCFLSNTENLLDFHKLSKEKPLSSEEKVYKWIAPPSSESLSNRYTLKAKRRLTLHSSPMATRQTNERESSDHMVWRNDERNSNMNKASMSPKFDPYNFSKHGDSPSTHLSRLRLRSPSTKKSGLMHFKNEDKYKSSTGRSPSIERQNGKDAGNLDEIFKKPVNILFRSPSVAKGTFDRVQENKYQELVGDRCRSTGISHSNQDGHYSNDYKSVGTRKSLFSDYVCISSPPSVDTKLSSGFRSGKANHNGQVCDKVDSTMNQCKSVKESYSGNRRESEKDRKLGENRLDTGIKNKLYGVKKFAIIHPQKDLEPSQRPNSLTQLEGFSHVQNGEKEWDKAEMRKSHDVKDSNRFVRNTKSRNTNSVHLTKDSPTSVKYSYYRKQNTADKWTSDYRQISKETNKVPQYAQSTPMKANHNIRFDLNDTISTICQGNLEGSESSDDEIMTIT